MKKIRFLVLMLALCLSFSVVLSGCGDNVQNTRPEESSLAREILGEEKNKVIKVDGGSDAQLNAVTPPQSVQTDERAEFGIDITGLTGNVYDYYISPTITAFCNDLRASEKWYTTLSITVETYLNGIEVSSGASALSLRNIRVEMYAGSEDVYFTGVVDTGISDGASYAPAGGVVEGEITSTLAVGFEDLELSADGACLESAARVSLYNEAEPQDSSVAFRWTYDIYVNNKYNSSRVLGTSLPIAVKPL